MDRFTKMWAAQNSNSNSSQASPSTNPEFLVNQRSSTAAAVVQRVEEEVIDLSNLPADPAQRRPIWQFKTAKVRDDVRRSYLQKGPFQPKNHSFPQTDMSGIPRRFISAKNHEDVVWLFEWMSYILSTIGGSFKNRDMLREKQARKIEEALQMGELETGTGLNQELGLKRAGDTRWGSHFYSLMNMIVMFPSVIEVIDDIAQNGGKAIDRLKAKGVLDAIQTFDFVFMMHIMKVILGITNELSTSLQRKDQDIVNAISYLGTTKKRLQEMRDQGWEDMFAQVIQFCIKHDINLPDMDEMHVPRGSKSKRRVQIDGISNEDYYQSVMYAIIDLLHVELNDRFSESGTTLLLGMGCLDPSGSFSNFNKDNILAMARLYPDDFATESKIEELSCQLDNFVENIRDDSRFSDLKGVGDLCQKLVEKKKHTTFPLVFLLLKLTLVLPVATATVERAFSAMKYIKSSLRNRIGDDFLNHCLITYVENDVFQLITTDAIMYTYQGFHDRAGLLP